MVEQQKLIFEALKQSLRDKESASEEEKNYGEEHIHRLKSACESFLKEESFEVGQIVKWKSALKNRRLPRKDQPAIVVQILDEPIMSTDNESGSPYFLEKLDIILGILSDEDIFLTFYYDSSRFESY